MSVRLLDVNLLLALLDSAHVHHEISVAWFHRVAAVSGWASCPITEMGFVRVISNFSYPNAGLSPSAAARLLQRFKETFPHHFWTDDFSVTDAAAIDLAPIHGSRQITDAYLAALAFRNGGKLATLDGGVSWKAARGGSGDLVEKIAN